MLHIQYFRKLLSPPSLLVAMLSLLLSSCVATDNGPRTVHIAADPTILRVGVSANAPPLIYSKNNKITGLEAELAQKLGRFTKRKVKFVALKWEDQIPALENNQIDIIMSGMSITQAREYRIAFSNPYLRSGQILLVRLNEKSKFSTGIYSLMNSSYTIGVVKNTTGDLFITKTINGVEVKSFSKSTDAVQALINKDIDAFVYDAPMVCHYAAVNENNKLAPILTLATEEYIAWGIRKEDGKLRDQANAFLNELKEQQELPRMIRNWIPYM